MTTTITRANKRLSPDAKTGIAAGFLALFIVAFLTLNIPGNLGFVMELRIPKVAAMLLVGWATGIATVPFQTVTHNRLLTPSIMGLDALYVFLRTLLILIVGVTASEVIGEIGIFAITVSLLMIGALGLVGLLFGKKRRSVHVLVLAGLVLGTVLRSASTLLQRIMDPSSYLVLQGSLFASFTLIPPELLWVAVVIIVAVSIWLLRQHATLDVMLLGHDAAVSLGVDYTRFVRRVVLASTLLVAVSTALVGPITFLGLIVAALAHQIVGSGKHIHLMPMAGLLGALLLVGGQTVLEHGLGMATVLSVIIEFVGGIVFIWLIVRSSK